MSGLGYVLIGCGALTFLFPTFNGIMFDAANRSSGEGQIIGAVLFVGGLILVNLEKTKRK